MQRAPSCGYCFKPYSFKDSGRPVGPGIPRLLQCGHTFCEGCVLKVSELNPGQLPCPNCNVKTPLPGGKKQVKDLPTNLYILGILINNIRATLEKDFTKGELCDLNLNVLLPSGTDHDDDDDDDESHDRKEEQSDCEECCINSATIECRKCEVTFCKPCFARVHSSSRTLRLHEPLQYKPRNNEDNLCTIHATKELEFFDETDNKLICALCLVSAPHKGHDIVPIAEMFEKFKGKVSGIVNNVQQVQRALQQSKARLGQFSPKIKSECSDTIQHIKEHFEQLHTKIQTRQIELIKEVKAAFCQEGCFGLKDVAKDLYDKDRRVGELIEKAMNPSSAMIINEGHLILENLEQVKDISCVLSLNSLDNVVNIDYDTGLLQLFEHYGKIIVEDKGLGMKKRSECTPEELSDEDNIIRQESSENIAEEDLPTSPRSPSANLISLPMKCNLVYVTHIKNPCDFMIQHAADVQRLETLMEAINQYCENARALSDMVKNTKLGDVVCAQFSKDRVWYRARILGDQSQPDSSKHRTEPMPKVEVCYIDYGNTEVVPLNRLRKIKSEFMDIPELAVNCSLINVVPPLQNKTWPSQSIKVFGSLTRDKGLLMSIVKKLAGRLYVDLKSPEEEPTQDDDKPASVRDALVFLDVARFNSPASSANAKSFFPVRSYKSVALPDEGSINEVIVTYVEDPDHLYVMIDNGKEYVDMVKIVNQMSSMYSKKNGNQWNIPWPYKGLVCAGRFSGDQVWYRALVTQVGESTVDVVYVDFGNKEQLPFSEIRRIPDHMVQLPMQAMCCSLAAIQPVGDDGWSIHCSDYLTDLCGLNRFRMKVVEAAKDKPLSVVLHEIDHPEPSTVNQLLVDGSYARLSGDHTGHLERLPSESSIDGDEMSSTGGDSIEVKESSEDATTSNDSSTSGQERKVVLFPQALKYKPVEYPSNNKFQLAVTFVDEDCTIYGYQPENYDHSLPKLMKLVQNECAEDCTSSEVTHKKLSINSACCAKFSEDNLWYRAEVIGFPSKTTVLVHYVDFGNKEEVSLSNLKIIPAFLEIPKQCVPVALEGLPQIPHIQSAVSKHLSVLLIGQQCIALIAKPVNRGLLKCLKLTLEDGSNVVDVAKEMVKKAQSDTSKMQKGRKMQNKKDFAPSFATTSSTKDIQLLAGTCLPEINVAFDVVVTHVDTATTLYLQRCPPTKDSPGFADRSDSTVKIAKDHLNQLLNLSDKINAVDYFKGKQPPKDFWKGMLCCACYSHDGRWYRAEIIEVVSETHAKVLYFDYGTSEVVNVKNIKCFTGELIYLPRQAFQCSISGLEADGSKSKEARKAVSRMIKAVVGKKLICKVVEFQRPIIVELYERVFTEEDSFEDILLSQRLCEDDDDDDDSSSSEESSGSDVEVEEVVEIEGSVTSSDIVEVESDTGEIIVHEERQPITVPQLLRPAQFNLMNNTEKNHGLKQDLDSEVD